MKTLNDVIDLDIIHAVAEGQPITLGLSHPGTPAQYKEISYVGKSDLCGQLMDFFEGYLNDHDDFSSFKLTAKVEGKDEIFFDEVLDYTSDDLYEILENSDTLLDKIVDDELWVIGIISNGHCKVSGTLESKVVIDKEVMTTDKKTLTETILTLFEELSDNAEDEGIDIENGMLAISDGSYQRRFKANAIPALERLASK